MPPAATRTVEVVTAPGLKQQYRTLKLLVPEIADAIAIFNEYKREIPPRDLPGKMKDHALKGGLAGTRECHLAADILLLYTHEDDLLTMLKICRHDGLYGKRGTATKRQVRKL